MRIYNEVKANIYGHEDILKKILDVLKEATVPRDMDGSLVYLESCYVSKRLFTRISQSSKKLSDKELVWLPTTRVPVYQMIFNLESKPDDEYYNISLIANGADVTHFAGVSGTSYFFMDDGEKSTYLG